MLAQSIHRIRRYAGFAASTVSRQGLVESLADLASELAFDLRYRSNTVWPFYMSPTLRKFQGNACAMKAQTPPGKPLACPAAVPMARREAWLCSTK
jgi:hypothetical protein